MNATLPSVRPAHGIPTKSSRPGVRPVPFASVAAGPVERDVRDGAGGGFQRAYRAPVRAPLFVTALI